MAASNLSPEVLTITTTSTGRSASAKFGVGMSAVTAAYTVSGTTEGYTFTLQGSIGRSGIWTNLTAATTASTAGAVVNSTVATTFDKVAVNLSANGSKSSEGAALTFHILPR